MIEYSIELKNNIEKISIYYEKHDTFNFLQKIINFISECINYYIPEKYFVISKEHIYNYTKAALKIWGKDGSEEELNKIKTTYLKIMNEEKSFDKILKNKKEHAVMNCMLWILHNGYDDLENQFVYDFIELFIGELEKVEIKEEWINKSLEKYFNEIIDNGGYGKIK